MHHLQMRHSHGNGDQSLPLLMDVAIRLAEAEGMPKNCPTLVEQYNNVSPSYLRVNSTTMCDSSRSIAPRGDSS